MDITLIACVVYKNYKFGIGANGNLLYHIHEDMEWFKNKTMGNTVVMGYKTWMSLGKKCLKGRRNIILTKKHPDHLGCYPDLITTFEKVKNYFSVGEKIFIIGGSEIFTLFLKDPELKPSKLLLTLVEPDIVKSYDSSFEPSLIKDYLLVHCSPKYKQEHLSFRFLSYEKNIKDHEEQKYLDLASYILENGNERKDRTGTGTISIFGAQLKFDISNGNIPLLTTRKVPFKAIVEELLFFCRGDTNATILDKKGVKIWNGNTTREFLDNRGLVDYPEGCMGPMYGFSWRHFGAEYNAIFSDTSKCDTSIIGGFDQLAHVENLLKTDPFSRRIYISNLNPLESSKMCLEPCHTYIQFYVEEINGLKHLSAYFTMRSSDSLAWCYNILSYTLLVNILALKCDMKPKEIVYNSVDCHIYKNHVVSIKEQLSRTPRPFPNIKLDESIKSKDWNDITYEDFDLIGYFPHPFIKMPMSI